MEQGAYNPQTFSLGARARQGDQPKGEQHSAATLLMKNILVCLAYCCFLVQQVGTIWVAPLQISDAVASPNAMADPVGYSIRYFDLSSMGGGAGNVVFALGNGANKQIKAFDQTGAPIGVYTASELPATYSGAAVTVALTGKPRLFISVGQILYTYDIATISPGTYTLTYSSQFDFQSLYNPASTIFYYFSFLDYVKPGTNYLYFLARISVIGARDYVRVSRLQLAADDISVSTATRYSISGSWDACPLPTSAVVYENSFQLDHLDSNTGITNCRANLTLFQSMNSNFPVLKTLNNAGAGSYFKIDNLGLQILYMSVFLNTIPSRLDSVDLSIINSVANGAAMPLKFTSLTTVPYARGGLLNFGNFAYLGVVGRSGVGSAELHMVDKLTFTVEPIFSTSMFRPLSGDTVNDLGATEAWKTAEIEYTFAFSSGAANNGIFFNKVIFELCTNRDPTTQVCSKCVNNAYLQNTNANNVCIRSQDIPSGWGIKASANDYIEPCQTGTCKSCRSDSSVCTDAPCDVSQGYVVGTAASAPAVANGACILRSALPAGYGAETSTYQVKPCVDANCRVCRDDITSCNFCKNGFFLDETLTARVCTDITTIVNASGRDPTSTARFPCMPGCLQCKGTPVQCTLCDNPQNYYLDTIRKACVLISDIPPKFGPKLSSGEVAACVDPNCLSCPQSTLVCAKCDMSLGFFLDTSAGVCKLTTAAPAQKGADFASGTFQSCSVGCVECAYDHNACLKCDKTLGWYRDTKLFKCLQKPSFASGEGADNTSGDIRRCSDPGCIECDNDFQVCTECDTILFLNTTMNQCQPMSVLSVASIQFIKSSLKAFVVFKQKIMTKDYLSLVDVTLLDGNGQVFTDYSNLAITQITPTDTLLITMNFTGTIVNGKILIKNKPNTDFAFETDNGVAFPMSATITIPNIVFSADSAKLAGSVEAGSAVVKSFSSTAKIILVGVSPAASVVLDKIGAYFSYLQYLDGPTVVFPDLVLSMLSGGDILPWAFPPNLFVPWANSDCTPKPRYLEQEADCNIMVNYGPKLIVIATIIVFSILLLLLRFPVQLCLACKRKSLKTAQPASVPDQLDQTALVTTGPDPPAGTTPGQTATDSTAQSLTAGKPRQTDAFDLQSSETVEVVDPLLQDPCFRFFLRFQLNYGFKYLLVFMEGVCLEACGYAVINLFNVDRSPQQVVGGSISTVILLYYAFYGYMVTEYVSAMNRIKRKDRRFRSRRARMQRALARRQDTDLCDAQPESAADADEDLADPQKDTSPVLRILEGHRYSLVDYTVDEYKPHLAREWYYFTPVLVVAKNVLLQLTAYLLSGTGYTQLAAVTLIEALTGAYAIASRVNEKPVENFLDAMNSVLYVVYLLMKAVTLSEKVDEDTRQKSLGYPMAATLVILVLVNVVFISVVAMKELWGRGKLLYKRWKKRKEKQLEIESKGGHIDASEENQVNLPKLGPAIQYQYDIPKAMSKPSKKLDKPPIVTKIGLSNLAASSITSQTQQTHVTRSVLKPNKHKIRTFAGS